MMTNERVFYKSSLLLVTLFFLTGCQQKLAHPVIAEKEQLDQLSALVAGSSYLRQYCHRSDIPADPQLLSAALNQAGQHDWRVSPDTLMEASQQRFQALTQDKVSPEMRCAALNGAMAPFVEQARQVSMASSA